MFKLADILLNPKKTKRHPFEIMLVAFFYTSFSILISYWIFPEYSSLFSIFLSVISCIYVVQGVLISEEKKERDYYEEVIVLKRHAKTIKFFLILFLGFLIPFIFWTLILPQDITNEIFSIQETEVQNIRSITGNAISSENFSIIFLNNMRVLAFSLILALFYGAGSIFILVWNASIMGFVIG